MGVPRLATALRRAVLAAALACATLSPLARAGNISAIPGAHAPILGVAHVEVMAPVLGAPHVEVVSSSARAALHQYAAAFAAGRYAVMWALLAPGDRRGWGGVSAYAAYYRAKFAPVRLRGFTLGVPRVSGATVRIPLSLAWDWRATGPPGILSLFNNMESTLVRTPAGWRVAEGGPLDPEAPLIPPPVAPARTSHVPILMYHHISSAPPAASQEGLTVTDAEFTAQLAYLSRHGFHAIRLVDLFNYLYYGRALPLRPVVLTFDDGYVDNYTDAFPLLRRYHMVAEFNIITAYPGTTLGVNRYMTWEQIEAMAAVGMEMESHTVDHQDLGLMDTVHAAYELRFSRGLLAAHIHRAVQFLAYPSGEPFRSGSLDAQQRILSLLPQYGYAGALLDPIAPGTLQDARAPYQLPRVRVSNGEPLAAFAAALRDDKTIRAAIYDTIAGVGSSGRFRDAAVNT